MIVRAVLEVSSREQGQEDANWASQLFGPKAEHELARAMQEEIEETHRLSGATIHFSPDDPLPASLVNDIVRARLKEEAD